MSEPKRYGHKAIIYPKSDDDTYITVPIQEADGPWVSYMDYCRLKAEVERLKNISTNADRFLISGLEQEVAILKAEVDRLTDFTTRTIIPNEKLQAQVERLTKAGDAFSYAMDSLAVFANEETRLMARTASLAFKDARNATKEGKQSK